jgi:hypothetical protein
MKNPMPLPEPHFLRYVQDYETLSDLLQVRIERESARQEPILTEAELFTTEWQMTPCSEEMAAS